ncbi:hypothetical protein DSO57_1035797 [Entomophthora muscae]|uniref:Uncharacterized protein n=1 Tax=Entomophthora muscae TaxID=34485 RepID=A0ACC2TM79_9FUNG|nr:hypothetical protein DSO57_1035797 [Entomophthora muscae]
MAKASIRRVGLPKGLPKLIIDTKVDSIPVILSNFIHTKSAPTSAPIKVLPGLYLGNERHASDKELLLSLGIGSVLNVAVEVAGWPELSASYLSLGWTHNQCDIISSFEKAFSFIDNGRASSILVHCQEGISRSASLIIAYLMRTLGLSASQAYSFLKSKSPAISPNINLFSQLIQYEHKILPKCSIQDNTFCLTPVTVKRQRSSCIA